MENSNWIEEMKIKQDKFFAEYDKTSKKLRRFVRKTRREFNDMVMKRLHGFIDYRKARQVPWKTKDGRIIKVKDLETDHAINIIVYLRDHGRVPAISYWRELHMFSNPLGGVMSDAEDMAFDNSLYHGVLSKMPSPAMDAVLLELKHRKIDIVKEIEKKEKEDEEKNETRETTITNTRQ